MARPKGSKNKTAEVPVPQEFDYERDDTGYDGTYQVTTITSAEARPAQPEAPWTLNEAVPYTPASDLIKSIPAYAARDVLFLVEGDVQLSSREPGRGSMVAKQTRLVRATNDNQAVEKFSNYFRGLSDAESVYLVIRAAAMETIV